MDTTTAALAVSPPRARECRDRRRARMALAVGLSIVVTGALLAVTALRDDAVAPVPVESRSVTVGWELPETPYLWPENWARAEDRGLLSDMQDAADAGTPAVEWRLDPDQVVRRFLLSVLAWEEPQVRELDAPVAGMVFVAVPACSQEGDCIATSHIRVLVQQPATSGDGGVWSVVSATSDDLSIRPPLGKATALLAGSQVGFELTLPEGRSAHAGLVASNGCREASGFELALKSGTSTLGVPDAEADDPSCGATGAGYLFVYAMDDTVVPTGDPLLEAAAIEDPWLTIVPVEVQMGAAAGDEVLRRDGAPIASVAMFGGSSGWYAHTVTS